jgi:hypothetical protein
VTDAFETFYSKMHISTINPNDYPLSLVPTLIQEDVNNKLTRVVHQQEIKEALDQMNPDKSPGPDDFTTRFYQSSWDIIISNLTKMI